MLVVPDVLQRVLHETDRDLSGRLAVPDQITTPEVRDRYRVTALIEEAITSSQLEGAATTRKVASEMLRSGRRPRDQGERMIFNNFHAMEFVRSIRDESLTPELVFRIHRAVTEDTLEDETAAGRLRTASESGEGWGVYAPDGTTLLHQPPPAEQLEQRLIACCSFANDRESEPFIHPIVRSILLHFWIGHDHPFVDGNGRTARTIFYWSMLRHGYWLAEYLSISSILRRAPVKYAESYLLAETDENDTTYFVLHHIDVLKRATSSLMQYLTRKLADVREAERLLKRTDLNHRQVAVLGHALRHPAFEYRVTSHANSHRVTRQTARTDLLELARLGLLKQTRRGKEFRFRVPPDLQERLQSAEQEVETGSASQPGTAGRRGRRP